MDQGAAIVLAGLVGGLASVGAQQVVERQGRRRVEIDAVQALGAEAQRTLAFVQLARTGFGKRMSRDEAKAYLDSLAQLLDGLGSAHTALVVHARAKFVDLGGAVLDAAGAYVAAAADDDDTYDQAFGALGNARLSLLLAARRRRLGEPAVAGEQPTR